ncbi:amidohydrolase family protein [Phytoactinopolyspora limicola]|uniref:amidohydrolase family protein n=1 Tax=Phytoactinopolyspora limicola TaxID=2715536 RepID=UPI00140909FF|nr:amidohydrolase family protein [Phytoactinopolyspora limicola]
MVAGARLVGGTVLDSSAGTSTADVVMADGRLAAPSTATDLPVVDISGRLVLPGLVNVHDHLRSLLPATRAGESLTLSAVVDRAAAASGSATAAHYRTLSAMGAARLVLGGVTSVIDHIYPVHRPGMVEAAVAGHESVGVRASMAVGLMDVGRPGVAQDAHTTITQAARLIDDILPAERLFLAPVSLRQSTPAAYRAAVDAADRLGPRLYTHIAESEAEVERCLAEHGMRPVELLHSFGFLRPGTIVVHCVHLDERDRQLLAGTGTAVAYCPSNHLRFAKGFAPVRDLLDRGVPVGLGIDGMADGFAEMRQAIYAQGSATGHTGAISSEQAFRMATSVPASMLGIAGLTGDLRVGDRADVVVVAVDRPGLQPVADPLWTLVHRTGGTDVTDVFVDGQPVVRDGRLVRVDPSELVEKATAATTALAAAAGVEFPPYQGGSSATPGSSRSGSDRASR